MLPPSTLLHGTKACKQVVRAGFVRPSTVREIAPTLADALRYRERLYSEAGFTKIAKKLGVDVDHDTVHEEAMVTWDHDVLIPMRGYSYATSDLKTAKHYAGVRLPPFGDGRYWKNACVLQVEPMKSDADILPDEDWVGAMLVAFAEINNRGDYKSGLPPGTARLFPHEDFLLGDPGSVFSVPTSRKASLWMDRLPVVLPASFWDRLRNLFPEVLDVSDGGYDLVALRAPLGRSVIRAAQRSAKGRAWLQEGLMFTPNVAIQGPLRVIKRIRPVNQPSPLAGIALPM